MNCKNCNQIVQENFCAHCGQNTKVSKLNLPNFLSEVSESVFQIDKGFFYTLKELFVRPGHSIREYLAGKRKNHFKPIAYAITISTIYFLISQFTESGTVIDDFTLGYSNAANDNNVQQDSKIEILNWFSKNYAYTVLMLLPFYSFASFLAFFGLGYNYLEHLVINAYIIGQQAIFYSFFALLTITTINNDFLVSFAVLFSISYTFYVFLQFFSKKSNLNIILRTILTYTLYIVILRLFLSLISHL